MRMLLIVGFVCLLVACIMGATAMASKGYRRVKAGFNIGRSGFYIEADDDEVRKKVEHGFRDVERPFRST